MSDELQDDVRAAMEEVSQAADEAPATETVARDEAGKFAPKADEVAAAAKLEPSKEPEAPPAERLLTEDKPPRGWSPEAREKWTTIPEDIRSEIVRREEASAVGVRQLQERYQPYEQFVNNLGGYIQEASQAGIRADQYIDNVMQTERTLRTADVPGRFQAILAIADQYGVPLRDIINESVGQRVLPPAQPQQQRAQIPQEIMQELQEMRQWREEQQGGAVNSQIAEFSKHNEFFPEVHVQMANLIDANAAESLEEAYEMACWANPQIRGIMLQREDIKARQGVATGASVRPAGSVTVPSTFDDDDDLEATVRKAFSSNVSGRV
jgi:hypothetical protein